MIELKGKYNTAKIFTDNVEIVNIIKPIYNFKAHEKTKELEMERD